MLSLWAHTCVVPQASAQQPPRQPHAAALQHAVDRLAVVGNVLYVAAHPDDENTRLLAYLVGQRKLRTAYLSLTRGDGGQNLIGAEQGPALGLIRTQELLAARRVDGAEQMFTRARDFGYSKTPTETLQIWDRAQVLSDVVWAIRRFRPDVIITRFSPGPSDTHGHHTSSAILAQEAFAAAADPTFHPEQVAQVGAWQARRIYWNRSLWGGRAGDDLATLPKLDIGGYSAALGASYGEIAADSRSMHKSQGFGSARSRGPSLEYFQPLSDARWSAADRTEAATGRDGDLFAGIDQTWGRVAGSTKLMPLIDQLRASFDTRHPEASIRALLQIRAEMTRLPEHPWKAAKLAEVNDLIVGCAGLWVEATAGEYAAAPGTSLHLTLSALNRSPAAIRLRELRLPSAGGTATVVPVDRALSPSEPFQQERDLAVPADAPYSIPEWLLDAPQAGMYPVRDASRIGQPENRAPLNVEFVFSIGGEAEPLIVARPVLHKWTDPVHGERHRALEITPPALLQIDEGALLFSDAQPRALRVRVQAGRDGATGSVRLDLPADFSAEPASQPFSIDKKGASQELTFRVRPPAGAASAVGTLRAIADVGGVQVSRGLSRIDHPHIPIQTMFPVAEVRLVRMDLKKGRTRIGYIPGAGDDVAAALRQVGYEVTLLDGETLERTRDLTPARFQAIVVGVRAYNTNPRLAQHHSRLMEYVAAGGNLIAQYNTNNRLAKLTVPMGPFPFDISQDRVTDETAAVTFERADHPIALRPNRLTDADWAGWVQERGLYFADKWDARYDAPISLHDPGESPKRGAILIARHGKGAFIYTGLAFFRQLPAGVPGAFRLLSNLISYGP